MLTYEIRRAEDADAPLIVLMHGRGANRFDLLGLVEHMPRTANVVFPEAPHGAAQWGYGPGSAWYRFLGRNKPDPASFEQSMRELGELVASFSARKIVLGGFSQGGVMAMAYAISHPGTVAGALNFSGFLADHPTVQLNPESVKGTSFFWGHGTHDPAIPFELALEGRSALRAIGADLEAHDYDIGHWIDPRELQDAVDWLTGIL